MDLKFIHTIASDLGLMQFNDETDLQFSCRTVYSGMACWIKAATLDLPIGSADLKAEGVSRRHIFLRCSKILDEIIKLNPELYNWFYDIADSDTKTPIPIIRSRLLNHGDLLNVGFDTNIVLSTRNIVQLSFDLQAVFGVILQETVHYSGISTLQYTLNNLSKERACLQKAVEWISNYVKNAWWQAGMLDINGLQYFNPFKKSKNNYSCWQSSEPENLNNLILARSAVSLEQYDYYLVKPKTHVIHKMDSFLVNTMGEHIRVMMALRNLATNSVPAKIILFADHACFQIGAHLPRIERNLLEAYAWPHKNITDQLEWDMILPVWEYVRPYMEALGIDVLEENHG